MKWSKSLAVNGVIVGVGRIELFLPQAQSLKDKRQVLKGLSGKVSSRFNVAVAEIDHHELRQRGVLAIACVARTRAEVEKSLRKIADFAEAVSAGEIVRTTFYFYDPDQD